MNSIIPGDSIHLTSSSTLSYYRSVNSLAVVVRYMEDLGFDVNALLDGSGIHAGDLDDPDLLVTLEQELLVLRKIAGSAPDPKIGLLIGQRYHVGIHGKLGSAVMSCDTVLEAVKFLVQYVDLTMTYFQYDLKVEGSHVIVRMKELIDLHDLRIFICEKEFVSVCRIMGDIAGVPPPLIEIRLAYPKPAYAPYYEDVFKCPVHFNASEYRMIFDSGFLTRKLPMSDPISRKVFEKECIQLSSRIRLQETVSDQVRHTLHVSREGFPDLHQIARSMNVSTRTLKRRLSKEGTTYKAISADVRRNMAVHLIQTTPYSMEKIAAELGYSDVANFYRAFKSWTGNNPSHYRKRC